MKKLIGKKVAVFVLVPILFISGINYKSDFFEIAKQIEIFTTLFKEINMNYVDETNPAELVDSAIEAMLKDLDPYTHFWNEQDVETARIQNSGAYTGIGAFVKTKEDNITIIEPYKDYPADKAGLKAGDEIIKIGEVLVSEFQEDAGELLKGAPNTKVLLTYKRQGKTHTTTLTRESVEVKAVPFYKLLDNKTGYIVLSKFNRKASQETKKALEDLKEKGAQNLILDLRGNPGGLLTEAIHVTNLFVPKGTLVTTTKSIIEKYNKEYHTQKHPVDVDIPLVVLIDGKSASASEIVAGSLQDLDRAVIVGARSFGKGLVQRPKKLSYGTQLKVTISRYYTPSGRCIQALDYRQRDENGNAIKTKTFNEFVTKNGRKVYDGGGILPDIEISSSKYNQITSALENQDAIFDFSTQYYYSNEVKDLHDFRFTNRDFSEFKQFLKEVGFSYTTQTEKLLEKAMESAKQEDLDFSIEESHQQLLAQIEKEKELLLDERKPEIVSLLTDEIIKRYFYNEGLYEYQILHSEEILESKNVLSNLNKYQEILNSGK